MSYCNKGPALGANPACAHSLALHVHTHPLTAAGFHSVLLGPHPGSQALPENSHCQSQALWLLPQQILPAAFPSSPWLPIGLMTFTSHSCFPATASPPSVMHIFVVLKPGRDVRAGLAEPLMECNCLLERQPGCTWTRHRFPSLSCFQELPLQQVRPQLDHQGD